MQNDNRNEYLDYLTAKPCIDNEYTQILDVTHSPYYRQLSSNASYLLACALSTQGIESQLSHFLADKFNKNVNPWDKVIDSKYIETKIGGSALHHNLDGQHTFSGALDVLREHYPDDTDYHNVLKELDHFARDLTTPSGINPFLSPDQFIDVKDFLHESFHIPKSHINDLLNENGSEVLGLTVASLGLILEFNTSKIDKLGQFASRFLMSGYFAGNPLMLVFATVAVARICFCLWNGESFTQLLEGASRGIVTAGSFFWIATTFSPPIYLGIALGVVVSIAASYTHSKIISFIKEDFSQILQLQFPDFKSYAGVL